MWVKDTFLDKINMSPTFEGPPQLPRQRSHDQQRQVMATFRYTCYRLTNRLWKSWLSPVQAVLHLSVMRPPVVMNLLLQQCCCVGSTCFLSIALKVSLLYHEERESHNLLTSSFYLCNKGYVGRCILISR